MDPTLWECQVRMCVCACMHETHELGHERVRGPPCAHLRACVCCCALPCKVPLPEPAAAAEAAALVTKPADKLDAQAVAPGSASTGASSPGSGQRVTLMCRAVDATFNTQPPDVAQVWCAAAARQASAATSCTQDATPRIQAAAPCIQAAAPCIQAAALCIPGCNSTYQGGSSMHPGYSPVYPRLPPFVPQESARPRQQCLAPGARCAHCA